MKEKSLKQILLDYLNNTPDWVTKGTLGVVAEQAGYLPESSGRHLRQLAEDNEIQISYYKGKRNQKLSRYARIGEKPKPKRRVEIINGIPYLIEN